MVSPTDVAAFHAEYDSHPDDRVRLFAAVAGFVPPEAVLYPGSYVDIAPSVFFDDVTYVDSDRRAARFFDQVDDVVALVDGKRAGAVGASNGPVRVQFHAGDYRELLPVEDESMSMLVSLYAGFVSEHCGRYLAPGGWLLANNSHGDVAMATLSGAFTLAAAVTSGGGDYRVRTDDLDAYLVPKAGAAPSAAELRASMRGIAYTKPAFAYVFQKQPPD